jgi:protein-L-isoaspartate(D-aspartate) O-methyltransferase
MMMTSDNLTDQAAMRHAMVASQLRTNAVSDARVVATMARVPRERYLPEAARDMAYRDTALPLGRGRYQNLPIATGRMLTEAQLLATDHVLLVGAAGGYTAAVLAQIVASVVALESDSALIALARTALEHERRVEIVEGSLEAGHADGGPYDLIFVDGAIERVPEALIAQLKPEGRMVAGLAETGISRLAAGRRSAGGFALLPFADIDCVPLPGFAHVKTFTF